MTIRRWTLAGAYALVLTACSSTGIAGVNDPGQVVLVLDKAPS
jgi:hypothetical protein